MFWSEDISVLLDQYQDIREQQEELTARNRLLQKAYQKEAERSKNRRTEPSVKYDTESDCRSAGIAVTVYG